MKLLFDNCIPYCIKILYTIWNFNFSWKGLKGNLICYRDMSDKDGFNLKNYVVVTQSAMLRFCFGAETGVRFSDSSPEVLEGGSPILELRG